MGKQKHLEMIIDYVVAGEDFQYSDNHGILTRCGQCARANGAKRYCSKINRPIYEDDYCSWAERKDNGKIT